MPNFKQYLKKFTLGYLLFAFMLWIGLVAFGDLNNELGSYLLFFTLIFGLAVIFIQSVFFSMIEAPLNNQLFFTIDLVIQLIVLNIILGLNDEENFTLNMVNDLMHHSGDFVFPLVIHVAIIISVAGITWLANGESDAR